MRCLINPNQRDCPICGSSGDITIEDGFIYCENCSAEFIDPRWAEGPDDYHDVTFSKFEDDTTAAEVMQGLASLSKFMPRASR